MCNSMKTIIQKAMGVFTGFVVVFLCAAVLAPAASAQTYYYPVSYQPYAPFATYSATSPTSYEVQILLNQLYTLMAQLQALQAKAGYTYTPTAYTPTTYIYSQNSYKSYDIRVKTTDVDVDGDEATFYGEVDIDDASYVDVWFIYGTDGDLDEKTRTIRVTRDTNFRIAVDDLDKNDRYYVRAVAEDSSGHRVYGEIRAFTAGDDRDDAERPDVRTEDAEDVDEDSAELHGSVDMNGFKGGRVFFVYGQDKNLIEDVADEDTYRDVNEDGDDLQKVQVHSKLDGKRSFWVSVYGLDDDTHYYFRICVEYVNEDRDTTLECGNVKRFTTED